MFSNTPWVESPFFTEILAEKKLSSHHQQLATEYHEKGFVVCSGLVPEELIDSVKTDLEQTGFNFNIKIKRRDERRLQDFWLRSEPVKALAAHPAVMEILQMLYDRLPLPFQTLNFKYGSQQRTHSDTIHFSALPARFMCGVWIALEDITEENGPVFYYPGSQRLPEYSFADILPHAQVPTYEEHYHAYEDFIEKIVAANGLTRQPFLAKKGDVLIWSSNILHGGTPVINEAATRWSQVTHYFFEDCYYYTPMLSDMVTGDLYLRNNLVDIATGQEITGNYNKQNLHPVSTAKNLYRLQRHPDDNKFSLGKLFKKK